MHAVFARAVLASIVVVRLAATVAAVPVAPGVVVAIIARLVALPINRLAGLFGRFNTFVAVAFERAIKAFAFCAILVLVRSTSLATTVAPIPCTASIIVLVVAPAVALVFGFKALAPNPFRALVRLWLLELIMAVQTFAFFALRVDAPAAAVSTVPLTASDVVAVIAVAIALVNGHAAVALDLRHTAVRGELEVAVKALALGTMAIILLSSATITAIPAAAAVVVVVVANPIFDPFRLDAASITPWATAVLARGRCLKLGVAAKTFLAVSVNIFNSTAVATIPVAATKVVHVITIVIAFELFFEASFRAWFGCGALLCRVQTLTLLAELILFYVVSTTIAPVPTA